MPRRVPHVCCEGLEQKLQGLHTRDSEIKEALARVSKGQLALRRRRRHLEQVALHVLCQSGGSQMLAQQFLERDLGEHGAEAVTQTFVAVVAAYEGMSEHEIIGLRSTSAEPTAGSVARTAARFLKECHLAKWVEKRNMEQNIAPLVALVAHEARASKCLPPEPTSIKLKSQLQWLRRWRRRWNVTLGCIAAREHIPPDEGRRKASLTEKVCARDSFWLIFGSVFVNDRTQNGGHYMAAFWGPPYDFTQELAATRRPPFSGPRHTFFQTQATAVWHWANFLHARIPPHERAVVVNMDETSIRLYQKPGKGYVVKVARKEKRSAKSLTRNVTKGQLLGTFTHVAMICDDADLQPHLPQFLFINQTQISQAEFESIQGEWLPNVHARRVANPWMTNDKMKVVLKGLADAVSANSQNRRVVLCSDAHKTHIATSTWTSAAAHNIFYFIVPAKLTWALQPCDTHLFALFKNMLCTTCQKLAILNGRRRWDITLLMKALNTTIGDVLNKRSWRKAFDDLGYRGDQKNVSQRVLDKVDLAERPAVPNAIPSLAVLTSCFPLRTNIPIGHVFSAVLKADRLMQELANAKPLDTAASQPASSAGSGGPNVHLVRLGSFRQMAAPSVEVEHIRGASPSRPLPLPVARLARLGSSQRIGLQPTSHNRMRPPLPPPPDDPPGAP